MNFLKVFDPGIALFYLIATIQVLAGFLFKKEKLQSLGNYLTIAGFGLHTIDLAVQYFFSFHETLARGQFYFSFLAWAFLLVYFLLWLILKLKFLSLTAAPLALILFSSSLAISPKALPIPPRLSGLWFSLHIATLFISMGFLAMAFGAGITYLYLEKKIKTKSKLSSFSRELPSLATFDRVNHLAVAWGFPLFTLGILSGFIWAAFTWKRIFTWDPKEILAIIIWFLYAYLFHQRFALGWKGRKPAKLAIIIFVLTVLSMVGVNFFTPGHHSFKP